MEEVVFEGIVEDEALEIQPFLPDGERFGSRHKSFQGEDQICTGILHQRKGIFLICLRVKGKKSYKGLMRPLMRLRQRQRLGRRVIGERALLSKVSCFWLILLPMRIRSLIGWPRKRRWWRWRKKMRGKEKRRKRREAAAGVTVEPDVLSVSYTWEINLKEFSLTQDAFQASLKTFTKIGDHRQRKRMPFYFFYWLQLFITNTFLIVLFEV